MTITESNISITRRDTELVLSAPHNTDAKNELPDLGGNWDPTNRAWVLPGHVLEPLRELLVRNYGYSDLPYESVVVRYELDGTHSNERSLYDLNRTLARRYARDEPVRCAAGVRVVEGAFPDSGGSIANPRLGSTRGVVLEVADVPTALLDELADRDDIEILPDPDLAGQSLSHLRGIEAHLYAQLDKVRELIDHHQDQAG